MGLSEFAGPGAWNDPDMLEVSLCCAALCYICESFSCCSSLQATLSLVLLGNAVTIYVCQHVNNGSSGSWSLHMFVQSSLNIARAAFRLNVTYFAAKTCVARHTNMQRLITNADARRVIPLIG